ncbi:MAG: hypothetical protein U0893_17365 [Chloroflexota bacterium]
MYKILTVGATALVASLLVSPLSAAAAPAQAVTVATPLRAAWDAPSVLKTSTHHKKSSGKKKKHRKSKHKTHSSR